jgi:outer membrane protein assembly factor BamB
MAAGVAGAGVRPGVAAAGVAGAGMAGVRPGVAGAGVAGVRPGVAGAGVAGVRPGVAGAGVAGGVAGAGLVFGRSGVLDIPATWSTPQGAVHSRPLVRTTGGMLCGATYGGGVFALSSQGDERWRQPIMPVCGEVLAGPGGTVVAVCRDGTVRVLDETDGHEVRSHSLGGQTPSESVITRRGALASKVEGTFVSSVDLTTGATWKHQLSDVIAVGPVSDADGHLYVATYGLRVVCLDAIDGHERWSQPLKTHVSSIVADGDTLYAAASYGRIFALSREDGAERWNVVPPVTSNPLTYRDPHLAVGADGTLYGGATNGHVFAYSPREQRLLWTEKAGVETLGAPVVVGDQVLYAGNGGKLQALSSGLGRPEWVFDSGGKFVSRPVVDGNQLVVADDQGQVHALRPAGVVEQRLRDSLEQAASATAAAPTIEKEAESVIINGIRVPRRPAGQ